MAFCGLIEGQNAIGTRVAGASSAYTVWFIKLNQDQDLLDVEHVLKSNYSKGGQVYLIDIEDGKYAMVGVQVSISHNDYRFYFDKDLVMRTIVEIDEGEFVFTGTWDFTMGSRIGKENKGDAVQQHFFELISGDIKKLSFGNQLLKRLYHFNGGFKDFQRNAQQVDDFKKKALKHFKKARLWLEKIMLIQ